MSAIDEDGLTLHPALHNAAEKDVLISPEKIKQDRLHILGKPRMTTVLPIEILRKILHHCLDDNFENLLRFSGFDWLYQACHSNILILTKAMPFFYSTIFEKVSDQEWQLDRKCQYMWARFRLQHSDCARFMDDDLYVATLKRYYGRKNPEDCEVWGQDFREMAEYAKRQAMLRDVLEKMKVYDGCVDEELTVVVVQQKPKVDVQKDKKEASVMIAQQNRRGARRHHTIQPWLRAGVQSRFTSKKKRRHQAVDQSQNRVSATRPLQLPLEIVIEIINIRLDADLLAYIRHRIRPLYIRSPGLLDLILKFKRIYIDGHLHSINPDLAKTALGLAQVSPEIYSIVLRKINTAAKLVREHWKDVHYDKSLHPGFGGSKGLPCSRKDMKEYRRIEMLEVGFMNLQYWMTTIAKQVKNIGIERKWDRGRKTRWNPPSIDMREGCETRFIVQCLNDKSVETIVRLPTPNEQSNKVQTSRCPVSGPGRSVLPQPFERLYLCDYTNL